MKQASRQLKMKDEEIAKVNRIRQDVEAELEDLTASLFQVNYYVLIFFGTLPFLYSS